MKFACRIALLFSFGVFPFSVSAEITINEIAWMGTDDGGANCEWIELRNSDASVVDLSTWSLTIENAGSATPKVISLGEAASVKYAGIAENGYYLIARDSGSCKELAPSKSADWLGSFGNGISNSGAKLILKEGLIERDVVDSKAGWEATKGGIGGKNTVPKETPQRQSSSWITASPTPRGQNQEAELPELHEEDAEELPPVVTVGGTAPLVPVTHPVPKLYVEGGPSRIVVAGADTAFSAIAYDSTGEVHKNADIFWAFGDGGQEKGSEVAYAYKKPGEYTAVVRAKSKGVSAVSLITVVVTDASVSIESLDDDGVTLRNGSDRLADLSGWKLRAGAKSIRLPADTVIAPGATAFFPYDTLHLQAADDLALTFPNGRTAFAYAKPEHVEAGLYEVQAPTPTRTLAVAPRAYAEDAVSAPVAPDSVAAAGAPLPEEETVILKERGFFSSLMASVFSSVADIFSR